MRDEKPGSYDSASGPGENRTDLRGVDRESTSEDGVMTLGLLSVELSEPFRLGRSLSISNRSFPGNDVCADLGVAGPLDVCVVIVDNDASDAEGASVVLSMVPGRVVFLSEDRVGGGGRTTADVEARRVCMVGRVRSTWLCTRGESTLRRL